MPVWNRADCVAAAIDSVLGQSERDFELLVVDDGSNDDLDSVLARYGDEPRVRLIRRPHGGAAAARNAGLAEARGEWIAYLDSDNRWKPEFLAVMGDELEQARRTVGYCDFNLWRRRRLSGRVEMVRTCSPSFRFRRMMRRPNIDINTFVHHRDVIAEVGGWDEAIERMNDWDFILRVTSRYEPLHVRRPLLDYYFCVSPNTITRTKPPLPSASRIREKLMSLRRASITHDTITYAWRSLPEEKYYNWVRFVHHAINSDTFEAACFPSVVQVEVSSMCNLACTLCPTGRRELGRPLRNMPLAEFKKIVDDMEQWLMLLILWEWGEPFLNPDLPEMIRYASERDIRTVTSTNAHFLTDRDYVERILKAGLSTLIIAVDSLTEEAYRTYRHRGDLSKVLGGLENVVAAKRRLGARTLINMRMVVMRHNEHEVEALKETARKVGADCFTVKTVNPSCGSVASDESMVPENPAYRRFVYRPGGFERIPSDTRCERIWMMTNVLSDGSVVPCCYDYDASMKVGNVFETPLSQIWNAPNYRDLRRRVLLEKHTLKRCRECHTSFKTARGGDWFIDRVDFDMPALSTLQYKLRKTVRGSAVDGVVRSAYRRLRSFAR